MTDWGKLIQDQLLQDAEELAKGIQRSGRGPLHDQVVQMRKRLGKILKGFEKFQEVDQTLKELEHKEDLNK